MSNLIIEPILCRAGTMDNYSWLISDKESQQSAIIDPSEAEPIIKKCQEKNIRPQYIFNTHHHYDHTDANEELKTLYGAQIVGGIHDINRIPGIDIGLEDGETFNLGNSQAHIIRADGHTIGHILWYFPENKALFTGDTLFNLCIGGLFEGSAEQMFSTLEKIKELPNDVKFYPGHEYTIHGMGFAQYYNPNSQVLKEYISSAMQKLRNHEPVAPITLGIEKQCNPYLQAVTPLSLKKLCNM